MQKIKVKVTDIADVGLSCKDENGKMYFVAGTILLEKFEVGDTAILWQDNSVNFSIEKIGSSIREAAAGNAETEIHINLTCLPLVNGIMAYWNPIEDAASYTITLYINDAAISQRTNARTECYCTFTGLAAVDGTTTSKFTRLIRAINRTSPRSTESTGNDYYVSVIAESRDGEIIARSQKISSNVYEL